MKRAPENDPKVSIVVPIYNVEKYLHKCVDSIIGQTYHNLEIILVDDGSPDNCPAICDEYQKKDSRVRVIHKPNGGLSDARNAGLDIATGEYVTFIDSDDWYAEDAIEILVGVMLQNDVSIACMRNASVSSDYTQVEKVSDTKEVRVISSNELLKRICEKTYSTSVCNKLFKRSLLENKRFVYGRLNEDFLTLCELLMPDYQVATVEYPGYFYYTRAESLTHTQSDRVRPVQDALKNSLELMKKASDTYPKLEQYFARIALYQARTLLFVISPDEMRRDSESILLINQCLRVCGKYLRTSSLKFTDKIILLLAKRNPVQTSSILQRLYRSVRG